MYTYYDSYDWLYIYFCIFVCVCERVLACVFSGWATVKLLRKIAPRAWFTRALHWFIVTFIKQILWTHHYSYDRKILMTRQFVFVLNRFHVERGFILISASIREVFILIFTTLEPQLTSTLCSVCLIFV